MRTMNESCRRPSTEGTHGPSRPGIVPWENDALNGLNGFLFPPKPGRESKSSCPVQPVVVVPVASSEQREAPSLEVGACLGGRTLPCRPVPCVSELAS